MLYYDLIVDERVKGFEYALDPDRLTILGEGLVRFRGRHSDHSLHLNGGGWVCDCRAFSQIARSGYPQFCRHVIATERWVEEGGAPA